MEGRYKVPLAGALAGLVNGLFGGGGGMVLLPLLGRWSHLRGKQVFATCTACILPVCAVSAALYFFRGGAAISAALPYLLGGLAGGAVGGLTFEKVPVGWLKAIFALFLLYGGVRYLL